MKYFQLGTNQTLLPAELLIYYAALIFLKIYGMHRQIY